MENKCCSCGYAAWKQDKKGKLHRSGDGLCEWTRTIRLPWSGKYNAPFEDATDTVKFSGGIINRKDDEPSVCAVYQPSNRD